MGCFCPTTMSSPLLQLVLGVAARAQNLAQDVVVVLVLDHLWRRVLAGPGRDGLERRERIEARGRLLALQHALQERSDRVRRERAALHHVALAVEVDRDDRREPERELEAALKLRLVPALEPAELERLAAHELGRRLERAQVALAAALAALAQVRQHGDDAARLAAAKVRKHLRRVQLLDLEPAAELVERLERERRDARRRARALVVLRVLS
ncbi:hypothetical protein PybrP1_012757 [[Pythium] brassicae (nom. inval.)]|nr:hypothetical protein PybrP1_012757 [[Pythium] brassicae (nom. inval.)]